MYDVFQFQNIYHLIPFYLWIIIYCQQSYGEVIQIQLGQAGSRIGYSFWKQLLKEHNLDQYGQKFKGDIQQNENISNFFEQQSDKTFRARSIFADMESHSLQQIMKSQFINVFPLENFCTDNLSTRNLWPIAFRGSAIKNQITQCIRREIEKCQRCSGFQILHSICGGSGSGLGSLVQQIIQQDYKSSITMNLSGLPSPGLSNIVVEPYNSLLSIYKLHEAVGNPCIFFQNEAFFRQKKKSLNFKQDYSPSSFEDVNEVVGKTLVNITSPSRFPCDGNTGIRKMSTNMVEYPVRKYFVTSIPYTLQPNDKCIKTLIRYQAFNFKNLSLVYTGKIQKKRKWISNFIIFRGPQWRSFDINCRVQSALKMKYSRGRARDFLKQYFKEEIPNKYFVSVVKSEPRRFQNSITSLQLCSVIEDHLQHIHSISSQMLRRKAFTHWYTSEGVELQQIAEAQSSVLDIVSDYRTMIEDYSCYGEQQHYSQYEQQ